MNRQDFTRLIAADAEKAEYLPIACLLRSGYGCAGYYNATLNEDLVDSCVLLNARLLELGGNHPAGRPPLHDFGEFLEEIVSSYQQEGSDRSASVPTPGDVYGPSIPLTAIPYEDICVLYPVAHISELMQRAGEERKQLPSFLDLEKSEIVRLLRTKIW